MSEIYLFSADEVDGDKSMKALLGGKGANLAEMCTMGLPVPPGMTIPTTVCNQFMALSVSDREGFLQSIMEAVDAGMVWIDSKMGGPTLVSVRSGAPVSMPGMMDTILNVGITRYNMAFWEDKLGTRTAWDSYRRLIQMLGSTAFGVPMEDFDHVFDHAKEEAGITEDTALTAFHLRDIAGAFEKVFSAHTGLIFSEMTAPDQLTFAVEAVFKSWGNQRAIDYREMYNIPDDMGTAVNIQAMVFGNMNQHSGTGVLFTRNPSTGEPGMFGEFLPEAQGEDVVAGIRTPMSVQKMKDMDAPWPKVYADLVKLCDQLEKAYGDMMDIEFTVQDSVLYMLQCRVGKRSAQAAIQIAMDMFSEGTLDREAMFKRVTVDQYKIATRPQIDPSFDTVPTGSAIPASPGIGVGKLALTADTIEANPDEDWILVTKETNPDDVKGMFLSKGILTAMGGATSHAAVVARGMDKPCVVGCTDLMVGSSGVTINGVEYGMGAKVTIDGASGRFWIGHDVPVIEAATSQSLVMFQQEAIKAIDGVEIVDMAGHLGKTVFVPFEVAINFTYLDQLMEHAQQGHRVAIDIVNPVSNLPSNAHQLGMLFVDTKMAEEISNLLVTKLLEYDHKDKKTVTILGSIAGKTRKALEAKGYQFAGQPQNMAEFISMGYATISPEFIDNVFGGDKKAYETVVKALAKMDETLVPKPMGQPVSRDYAVFTALGA